MVITLQEIDFVVAYKGRNRKMATLVKIKYTELLDPELMRIQVSILNHI